MNLDSDSWLSKNMSDKFSLSGKVIVVTGGTGILGNAFVNGIVEAGGTVGILVEETRLLPKSAQLPLMQTEERLLPWLPM